MKLFDGYKTLSRHGKINPEKAKLRENSLGPFLTVPPDRLIYEFEVTKRSILSDIRKHPSVFNTMKIEEMQREDDKTEERYRSIHAKTLTILKSLRAAKLITETSDIGCRVTIKGRFFLLFWNPHFISTVRLIVKIGRWILLYWVT